MRSPTRSRLAALVVGLGLLPLAGASLAGGDGPPAPARAPFTVHEWGTFTSVQSADGISLEGLAHEEEALPEFVYSRTKVRDCPLQAQGYKGLEERSRRVPGLEPGTVRSPGGKARPEPPGARRIPRVRKGARSAAQVLER